MKLYRQKPSLDMADGITGIAPIYKVSFEGKATLIGSGFWITEKGHLVTAWHVITDNIGKKGIDEGPIYAMQTFGDRRAVPRVLRQTRHHPIYDLALSETVGPNGYDADPTWTFAMTLEEPKVGDGIGTYSFLSVDQKFDGEKYVGITTDTFNGLIGIPALNLAINLKFAARINKGKVVEIFPDGRDRVMLPFPCFQSDVPIYGANSGGPIFDKDGRVCGINISSYEGQDISFHIPLRGLLEVGARDIKLAPGFGPSRVRTVHELAINGRVQFAPPLADIVIRLTDTIHLSFLTPRLRPFLNFYRNLKARIARALALGVDCE